MGIFPTPQWFWYVDDLKIPSLRKCLIMVTTLWSFHSKIAPYGVEV